MPVNLCEGGAHIFTEQGPIGFKSDLDLGMNFIER